MPRKRWIFHHGSLAGGRTEEVRLFRRERGEALGIAASSASGGIEVVMAAAEVKNCWKDADGVEDQTKRVRAGQMDSECKRCRV